MTRLKSHQLTISNGLRELHSFSKAGNAVLCGGDDLRGTLDLRRTARNVELFSVVSVTKPYQIVQVVDLVAFHHEVHEGGELVVVFAEEGRAVAIEQERPRALPQVSSTERILPGLHNQLAEHWALQRHGSDGELLHHRRLLRREGQRHAAAEAEAAQVHLGHAYGVQEELEVLDELRHVAVRGVELRLALSAHLDDDQSPMPPKTLHVGSERVDCLGRAAEDHKRWARRALVSGVADRQEITIHRQCTGEW